MASAALEVRKRTSGLAPSFGHSLAPVAVLVNEGHSGDLGVELLLHVLQERELVAGPPAILGSDTESVFKPLLGDLVGHRHRHEKGDPVALGHGRHRIGDGRVPGAGQNVHLFGVDEALGLGNTLLRLGLGVGIKELDLGTTEGFDPSRVVDLLNGHVLRLLVLKPDGGRRTRKRQDVADLDRRLREGGGGENHQNTEGRDKKSFTIPVHVSLLSWCRWGEMVMVMPILATGENFGSLLGGNPSGCLQLPMPATTFHFHRQ